MGDIKGTNVTGMIVPFDTKDSYPTHDDEYGAGGYRTVDSLASRNSIPYQRRKIGMAVYVKETDTIYRLITNPLGILDNTDWRSIQDIEIIPLFLTNISLDDGNFYKSSKLGSYEVTLNSTDLHGKIVWYLEIDSTVPTIKFDNNILWRYTDDLKFDVNSVNILEFETIDGGKTWLGRSNKYSVTLVPDTTETMTWDYK